MLPWWIISLSIIGTNIGATDYVGAAGGAYRFGITQAHYEWIGAISGDHPLGAAVHPLLLESGDLYGAGVSRPALQPADPGGADHPLGRVYGFSAGAVLLGQRTDVGRVHRHPVDRGDPRLPVYIGIVLTALIIGLYTISGGLAAVAMTDVIQVLVMFIGGIMLSVLACGLWAAGQDS
jgi:SSS family solute:Na+ symporter